MRINFGVILALIGNTVFLFSMEGWEADWKRIGIDAQEVCKQSK